MSESKCKHGNVFPCGQCIEDERFRGLIIPEDSEVIASLRAQLAAAQAFKAYVHRRLDEMGVPADPDSPHKAEGCRVGGRLDWVAERIAVGQERDEALEATLNRLDYLQNLWGKEAITERLVQQLRSALKQIKIKEESATLNGGSI